MSACDDCLRRADLVAAVAGRLDIEWRRRGAPARVLALPDEALLAVGASEAVAARYAGFDPDAARKRLLAAGLTSLCRCRAGYPDRLRDLPDPPAALFVLGDPAALADSAGVALVGARRASTYGLDVAHALGRGLSAAGVPVVSGLALGIDSAAHAGALEAPGRTVGVLAGSAEVPYPARGRRLHGAVAARGAVVSELPPGASAFRWCFVARNRIIAALAAVTVIVQAAERSGSLTTADYAADLGRPVGAVPGPVTTRLSAGTNGLLHAGAPVVRGVEDVLDLLADATGRTFGPPAGPTERAEALEPRLARLLEAVENGHATLGSLASTPEEARRVMAGLGELELRGLVRRDAGGRWRRAA
jgi:DNA processing protein